MKFSTKLLIATLTVATTAGSYQLNAMKRNQQDVSMEQESKECSICCEAYDRLARIRLVTPCNHELCLYCSHTIFDQGHQYVHGDGTSYGRTRNCPFCRASISIEEFKQMITDLPEECLQALKEEIVLQQVEVPLQNNNQAPVLAVVAENGHANIIALLLEVAGDRALELLMMPSTIPSIFELITMADNQ